MQEKLVMPEKYYELSKKAQEFYEEYSKDEASIFIKEKKNSKGKIIEAVRMRGYLECKELNLWTYWQGRNSSNPDIMVIGQDWGAPYNTEPYNHIKEEVEAIEDGKINNVHFNSHPPINYEDTDDNLYMLFYSLNLGFDDIFNNVYPKLFFTNGCLGYRTGNNVSNGFSESLITASGKHTIEVRAGKKKKVFLKELGNKSIEAYIFPQILEILQPKIILCLGSGTYFGMLKILGLQDKWKNDYYFNGIIEKRLEEPLKYKIGEKDAYIFPIAHPGALGTKNRASSYPVPKYKDGGRSHHYNNDTGLNGFQLQLRDWQYIKKFIAEECNYILHEKPITDTNGVQKLFDSLETEMNRRLVEWAIKWNQEFGSQIECEDKKNQKIIKYLRKEIDKITDPENVNAKQINDLKKSIAKAAKEGLIRCW